MKQIRPRSYLYAALIVIPIALVLMTAVLDFMDSRFQNTSYYLSESFLFGTFWWLFIPILLFQYKLSRLYNSKQAWIILIMAPIIIHFFVYPAMVWMLSFMFFSHTFSYTQTLGYELTAYTFIIVIVYTASLILFKFMKGKKETNKHLLDDSQMSNHHKAAAFLFVNDGNKRLRIALADICYIAANPPYIDVHHKTKKYLLSETLKSVSDKLNANKFVRVHKSCIVNVDFVQFYKSRLNGDYDLTMKDGSVVRLSRTYAANFKQIFESIHLDSTE